MRVLYIDELFLLNFIFDYASLRLTGAVCAARLTRRRAAAAAAFGALYGCLAEIPALRPLANPALRFVFGGIMLIIAFRVTNRLPRTALAFFLIAAAAAGTVAAAASAGFAPRLDYRVLAAALILSYAGVSLVFRRAAKRGAEWYCDVRVTVGERSVTLRALRDSGNSLRDDVTGLPVAVASLSDLLSLFTEPELELLRGGYESLFSGGCRSRFRPLEYRALGGSGRIAVFVPDSAEIDGKPAELCVGVSRENLTDSVVYNAVIAIDN
ncbi:MAG: sigma-E processing peptidase SpoIIGA [Oscillospiraceae bacterium]|jgi:stage II sporulation protein GA (sporulation sigma-E factor processing peptidase)|nr:sigma-E processing peptidase SpoIIGA [Oscillospiraceae bacterium]